jgi:predicted AlkP superfamily phosphohydrolase/phosphomutase
MSTPRVLVIGMDVATPELIEPWAEAGELPALSWLMRERAYGPLQTWPSVNSAAAWTSPVTGCNRAKHGIYDFGDIRPWREHHWRPVTGADRKRAPFWRCLSAAGQKVGLVNVSSTEIPHRLPRPVCECTRAGDATSSAGARRAGAFLWPTVFCRGRAGAARSG